MEKIKIIVNGACGKMGREVVKAVCKESDMDLVGAVDKTCISEDIGSIAGIEKRGIVVTNDLALAIKMTKADVVVDFTVPKAVMASIKTACEHNANSVVGTTGLTKKDLEEIKSLCEKTKTSVLVAPNFALGAILMMRFSAIAANLMPNVEIIELHHDKKLDAPSGTSIKTAEMIKDNSPVKNVPIHSVRLPGLVAHQEVIFGGPGQTLSIRHDTINRECFMPGVIQAIRKIKSVNGFVYGLDKIL